MTESTIVKKERNIGLDILRIWIMFLITARHYFEYTGVAQIIGFNSIRGCLVYMIIVLGQSAPNVFVLISGYFLVNSQFKINRIIKIWAETWFYSILFFLIGLLINSKGFSLSSVVFAFTPVVSRHYWFAVAYLVLVAVSPFLNKLIKTLSCKEYTILIVGGAIVLSAWTTVFYFSQGAVTGGHTGLLWFVYLYLVGSYININREKIKLRIIPWVVFVGAFVMEFLVFLLSQKVSFLKKFPITRDDSIFNLIISIAVFIMFLNIKLKSKKIQKFIILISTSSFGIYLIQENCMIREYLWNDLADANKFVDGWQLFGILILCFVVLTTLSYICEKIFNIIYNKCYNLIEKLVSKVIKT